MGGALLYMGKDKFENEELIKYAWPEDVWFHVDKESSAHVYIRLERCVPHHCVTELMQQCACIFVPTGDAHTSCSVLCQMDFPCSDLSIV